MNRARILSALSILASFATAHPLFAEEPVNVDVHGDALARASADETIASSVLDDDALNRPGETLPSALERVPGVTIARTGGSADLATASLRGATSAETSVYLGPIRLNDAFTGTADLSQFPIGFFRRVSVFRGHAPLRLERPGLGGAIVLEPWIPDRARAHATAELGSFGEHAISAMAALGDARASAALSIRVDGSDGDFDYTDDRGTRFDPTDDRVVRRKNADARSIDAWTAARIDLAKHGSLAILANGFGREQGAPGLAIVPAERAREKTTRGLVATLGSVSCGESSRCRVDTFSFARVGSLTLTDPLRELPFATERQTVRGTAFGAGASVITDLVKDLSVEAGARTTSEQLSIRAEGAAIREASSTSSRFFAEAHAEPAPALELTAGAAIDTARVDGPGAPERRAAPSARAGVALHPAEPVTVFASIARYVRPPTLGEQYGSSSSVVGNPLLEQESGGSLDIGARLDLHLDDTLELGAECVGFGRLASGLITYERSSAGVLKPFNLGDARVLGVEGALALRLFDVVVAGGSLTFLDPRDTTATRTTTNDLVPFFARVVATPSLAVEVRDLVHEARFDFLRIGADLAYRSPRFADPAGLVQLPEAIELGADAALGFARGAFTFRARMTNLLDRRTTDLLGYPLPGRAFHFAIEGATP